MNEVVISGFDAPRHFPNNPVDPRAFVEEVCARKSEEEPTCRFRQSRCPPGRMRQTR